MKVQLITGFLCWLLTLPVSAQGFLQGECDAPFPEAMTVLQNEIVARGYTLSRIQHVDHGLRERGYEVAKYRVVFFGRAEQMRRVRSEYPDLIPYLPLSVTIFEAPGYTAVNTLAPAFLKRFYVEPVEQQMLDGWQKDLESIVTAFAECDEHL